ncbi:MAG: prephenate dehydratase [Promethearchaeota archaeon]
MERIEKRRLRIDEIDEKLVELINERARVAAEIGQIKQEVGIGVVDPSREERVLEHVKQATDFVEPDNIEAIWRELMAACKNVQGRTVRVGYLGPEGTFANIATTRYFPRAGTSFVALDSITDVFKKLEADAVEFGVVPIENSIHGSVRETMDLLIEKRIAIYGEVQIRITHNLLGVAGADLEGVTKVYSHPQALNQCRSWLRKNLPGASTHETRSTAEAVRRVVEGGDQRVAAIGTSLAAEIYGATVLESGIEDNPNNYTRFLVLSKKESMPTSREKDATSVIFVTKHVPGALFGVLEIFAKKNINLLKIESRPQKSGVWEYIFWMDFEGHHADPVVQEALEETKEHTIWVKVLGSYPRSGK